MKQCKWLLSIIVFVLSALFLNACSFSIEVLPTAASSPTTFTPVSSTPTLIVPTPIPPAATPTLISIKVGTISMLEIVKSFAMKEIVRSLAFSPDGTVITAAGGNDEDFAIHAWDLASEQPIRTLSGHSNIVWDVTFSPDGRLLASVSNDRTAQIRDWRNGDILKTLNFPGEVVSVSFSPNGQSLAVGGVDEMENQIQNAAIWMYSVDSWEPLMKFPEYLNIIAMAFSPNGSTLVGGGTSRNVQVWRTNNSTSVFTLSHAHQVLQAAISPDGSTVATATCETVVNGECSKGSVWLWDLSTGKLIKTLTGFSGVVENVAFSTDGSLLVTASQNGTLRFYNTTDYQPLGEFPSPGGISTLAISPDGGLLATGNNSGEVHIWKIVYRP